jgi:hypothetical protein
MATPNRTASILDDLISGFKSDFDSSRRNRKAAYENMGKSQGRTAAQNIGGFAGRVASDVVGDETRNTYWRYNHPLAVSSFMGSDALKVTGMPVGYQALGGAALALGVMPIASGNFDIGNLGEFGRPKGYQALFADPTDKTKTTNPLGEFAGRYFLGRKGNILPYEQLIKERPDVTPDKYAEAVQSSGFMAKDFFGLQDDPTKSIAIGLGAGAALGAWGRRGKYSKGADGKIKVEPRVVTKPENTPIHRYTNPDKPNEADVDAIGRFWVDSPKRVEMGRAEDLIGGAIKGAVLGGAIGAVVPSVAELGAIKTQRNLSGEDSVSLLGYEVPMSAALITAGAGVGLNYWARKHFRPNDFNSEDVDAAIGRYQANRHDTRRGIDDNLDVKYNTVTKEWDYSKPEP